MRQPSLENAKNITLTHLITLKNELLIMSHFHSNYVNNEKNVYLKIKKIKKIVLVCTYTCKNIIFSDLSKIKFWYRI